MPVHKIATKVGIVPVYGKTFDYIIMDEVTNMTDLFISECSFLKTKIRDVVASRMAEIPGPVALLFKSCCSLSGGAISSIYHSEQANDFDLWANSEDYIKVISDSLAKQDLSFIRVGDTGKEYSGSQMSEEFRRTGKFVTDNAVTLKNRLQFIKLGTIEQCRPTFDFAHCMPHYNMNLDKLFISKVQWEAIRSKKLVPMREREKISSSRKVKLEMKGWVW